ncbi:MAG: M1 family metallopeptidase [Bacteroidales bacterium]|nr:M1 family metallopeptidase [Bacteroidales bacterium]
MLKKSKSAILIIVILISSYSSYSQDYFQQEVNYKIDVKLNDVTHELSAFETIEYINNSPDELSFIYFHIWPNAYDNNNTALAKQKLEGKWLKLFKVDEQRGYIDSLDFKVNGEDIKWEYDKEYIDICKLYLNQALKSGEKIMITTPFHVKLPKGVTSRLGHVDQTYQISQWFPKPAVYDKYGWHQMPYLNMGEFYSEFGSFDVSITLPKNYVVGATGDLQNQEEIDWLNELADKTAKIDSFDKEDEDFPESSNELKTIRYKQKNIHDFAWFADKRFHVLKAEREMPNSKRKVTIWAMFPNKNAELWQKSLEYIGDALYYYSKWYGDYPYDHCTAVHSSLSAGGGMEYPNITVIGNFSSDRSLEMVIMHEVGHNWFYGILGFNERKYTWQDEGINSFSEARYMKEKYGKEDVFYKMMFKNEKLAKFFDIDKLRYKKFHELGYLISARYNIDQHASLSAEEYSDINYGTITYHKVAGAFGYLLAYLGEDKFNTIMQKFYEDWKYKHPYPEDIRKAFEDGTGEDMSWLFDDLLKTTKKIDYKIVKVKDNNVLVKNKGSINAPVIINGVKNDSTFSSHWFKGFSGEKTLNLTGNSDVDKIVIDHESYMLELHRKNNTYKTTGLFKKTEPLRIRLFGIIENPEKTQMNFVPTFGWNNYNKYMLGAVFYNSVLPKNKFEYQIMPMYAFGSQDIAGSGHLGYTFYPDGFKIQSLKLSVSGKRYAYDSEQGSNFHSGKAEFDLLFRNKYARSKVQNRIVLNAVTASDPEDIFTGSTVGLNQYYNLNLTHTNNRIFYPYSIALNTQMTESFAKTSLKATYKIIYAKKKSVDFRLFAGTFLYKDDDLSSIYNFNLSGTTGINDYTYNDVFFGRYEDPAGNTFMGNQFIANDGAFATYTPYGSTNEWLTSLNITASLPYLPNKIPLKVFCNVAVFGETPAISDEFDLAGLAWEGGVKISMFGNNLEIFLPLLMSEELENTNDAITDKYLQRVRFSLRLNNLNLFKIIDKQFI